MAAGQIKIKLAKILEQLAGNGSCCDPEKLKRNFGNNSMNDWASWQGVIVMPNGNEQTICSWTPMNEIVKSRLAKWVDNDKHFAEVCEG